MSKPKSKREFSTSDRLAQRDGVAGRQQPESAANLIPGVSLTPPNGRTIAQWINPAAFALPANGLWGNAGRNIVDGPGLFQIDGAVARTVRIHESASLI